MKVFVELHLIKECLSLLFSKFQKYQSISSLSSALLTFEGRVVVGIPSPFYLTLDVDASSGDICVGSSAPMILPFLRVVTACTC
jgi:hypothetical protein